MTDLRIVIVKRTCWEMAGKDVKTSVVSFTRTSSHIDIGCWNVENFGSLKVGALQGFN